MRQLSASLFALAVVVSLGLEGPGQGPAWKPSPHVAASEPKTPQAELKAFHLPPGFVAQLVAAEPVIDKPINIAFDAAGRLWVTESVEYPFPAPPGRKGKDRVKILEDFAPDGKARKVTTFADGLNIPIGVLPLSRGALVYSIPNIYHLDGNDKKIVLSSYGFNDTHGMTGEFLWGIDGWVYACHGFSNTSKVKGQGPQGITMQSGNTYRFKPDGSKLEHFTHGQVNPFGLACDPLGNLYSCDCHSRPIYQLLRGAYYPSFGGPHDGLGFGPEMMSHDHGSTAIAGITYYAAEHFPVEFRDNIFIGNVVTNRINRDRLERHGSTYRAIATPDFLTSDDPWFRPVDIKLGPDGALYVADFYNRIIGHYEVPLDHPGRDRFRGRIWRIVYRGSDSKNTLPKIPNLARAQVDELVKALADPNLSVRLQATHQLVERGGAAGIAATRLALDKSDSLTRAHALWVLERQGSLDDRALGRAAQDDAVVVRVHAQRVLAERSSWSASDRSLALTGLKDSDAFVQRAAADALGRHPGPDNVEPLLALRHAVPAADTHLLHAVRLALRDQLAPPSTWAALAKRDWKEPDARALSDVCLGLRSPESAGFLLKHVERWPEGNGALKHYVHHIARYGAADSGKPIIELARARFKNDPGTQAALFKGIQQGRQERGTPLTDAERAWAEELAGRLLGGGAEQEKVLGIELAGSLRMVAHKAVLAKIARDTKSSVALRKSAVGALIAVQGKVGLVAAWLHDAGESVEFREEVAHALAGLNQPEAIAELVKALEGAPARLQKTLALDLAGSKQGALKLLDAVEAGKASARLLLERPVELRLQQAQVPKLKERLAGLTRGLPKADALLQLTMEQRRGGFLASRVDPKLGAKVFAKHCAACHQIRNEGSKIGPQLDGIGIRGLERLLEDILDPSRNVDQAFRSTTLTLTNGKLVMGLFLRQDGEVLVLADTQGKEVRVPRNTVEDRIVGPLSPMPGNFADQIPEADFYHLMAFLLEQRVKR
jgi:putative heme-binding domain-containing protein